MSLTGKVKGGAILNERRRPVTDKNLAMQIQIGFDGTVKVLDGKGKQMRAATPEEFSESLKGKTIKKSEIATIMWSNPCNWVNIGGRWYWICW